MIKGDLVITTVWVESAEVLTKILKPGSLGILLKTDLGSTWGGFDHYVYFPEIFQSWWVRNDEIECLSDESDGRKFPVGLKTLDLHGLRHKDAAHAVVTFLNWTDPPCKIITGNSAKMKEIVKKIVDFYGYRCYNEHTYNYGSFIVVEDTSDPASGN